MTNKKISVVIPVYNSVRTLEQLFTRLNSVLQKITDDYEVVFVDDCSSDTSWEILKKLKSGNAVSIMLFRLTSNFGQHNATLCGLCNSTGEIIITMDDDLQHPPEELPKLIEAMWQNNAELVYGVSTNYKREKIAIKILKFLSKRSGYSPGNWSAFRLLKKELCVKICNPTSNYFNVDQSVFKHTTNITFVDVSFAQRRFGNSGYSFWSRLLLLKNILFQQTNSTSGKLPFIIQEQLI
ncbi:MAG: glycosyltransferase family 2 protein [Bacteroidia bacterium]|nr:glycosyltransferase family 2 protein [Bacteroidia bacterium]